MNGYELLMLNRNVLQIMKDASLDIGDIKYLAMYQEYVRLSKEGHKKHILFNICLMNMERQTGMCIV